MIWSAFERLTAFLYGKPSIMTTGSATLIGERRRGGYYYLKSKDLPGFTFLLTPDEANDIEKLLEAIKPALTAYLNSYFKFRNSQLQHEIKPCISYADLTGLPKGKMKLIAERCHA